jgi:hypothetical protein
MRMGVMLVLVLELSVWSYPKRFVLASSIKTNSSVVQPKFSSTSTSRKHEAREGPAPPDSWILAPGSFFGNAFFWRDVALKAKIDRCLRILCCGQ